MPVVRFETVDALEQGAFHRLPVLPLIPRVRLENGVGAGEKVIALEAFEILLRIVQPVGMVDAQSVQLAVGEHAEDQLVRRREDVFSLHAQRGEIVDVEETPIVDLVGGDAPERQPKGLVVEQAVKQVEALRVAGLAVEQGDCLFEELEDRGAAVDQGEQAALDDLFFALPLGEPGRVRFNGGREMAHGCQDALILCQGGRVGRQTPLQLL